MAKRGASILTIGFVLLFFWSLPKALAQTLFIDEDGNVSIETGQVLGEGSDDFGVFREEKDMQSGGFSGAGGGVFSQPVLVPGGSVLPQISPPSSLQSPTAGQGGSFQGDLRSTVGTGFDRFSTQGSAGVTRQKIMNAGGVKELRVEEGKLRVRIKPDIEDENREDEDEKEATAGSQTVERVRLRQPNEIEIRPSQGVSGSGMELEQRRVRARTHFPLSIGSNNELIVTTPAGVKEVTVLPETAVSNVLQRGFATFIQGESSAAGGAPSQPPPTAGGMAVETGEKPEIELTQKNGRLEYKVSGVKEAKLFGILPVTAPVSANVSAETGVVTSVDQPWYLSTFGFLFR